VPTGGGKSLLIAAFVHRVLTQWPGERIIVLTHVRELIDQNHKQLLRAWPAAPAGIYSAGLKRREHDARVLFAGIQSVYDKADKIGWADLVIVDECHLIPKSGMGMYRQLLDSLRSMNSQLKLIGLTATPFRTGEGSLDKGEDRLFDGVAYTCEILRLIDEGYLSRVTSRGTSAPIQTAGLHVRMGDFVEAEIEQAAMAGDLIPRQCDEIIARGADRKAWLVFCCSVDHARAVADALTARGVACATVFGETAKDDRDATVRDFKAGGIRCVVNVNVLTTGFDAPQTDLIVLLRPTMSPVLYVQMVGRGLRLADGKADCLVLDFGGNVRRHGPIDQVRINDAAKGTGAAPVRECPECQAFVPIAAQECECGYVFPPTEEVAEEKTDERPAQEEILSSNISPIERWTVQRTSYRLHQKPGKTRTLAVEYEAGFGQRVREWVCFDHGDTTFPYRKALAWWKAHGGKQPPPGSCMEAIGRQSELLAVDTVTVNTKGEWPEILGTVMKPREREPGEDDEPATTSDIDYSELPF
jgi:DNA repair protein RadD